MTKTINRIIALILLNTIIWGSFSNFAYNNNIINYKIISGSRNISDTSATTFADLSTVDGYKDIITNESRGGRYNGRIWTDKSVYAHDETSTVTLDGRFTEEYDEDFLTVFSTLGSTQTVENIGALDALILIDCSGSMGTDVVCGGSHDISNIETRIAHSRIYVTVAAVNNAIDKLMEANKNNRVCVVTYGGTAFTLMELGHYTKKSEKNEYISVEDFTYYTESQYNATGSSAYTLRANAMIDGREFNKSVRNNYANSVSAEKKNNLDACIGFSTNMQAGIYQGFQELYENAEDGNIIHIPIGIIMTDGGSNYALKESNTDITGNEWFNVPIQESLLTIANANKKYRSESTEINRGGKETILDILMTASYMKVKVEKKYKEIFNNSDMAQYGNSIDFSIHTISVDTPTTDREIPRVYTTLNPKEYFKEDLPNVDWNYKQESIDAYNLFEKWKGSPTGITSSFIDADNQTINFKINKLIDDPYVTNEEIIENIYYNDSFDDIKAGGLDDYFTTLINSSAFNPIGTDINEAGIKGDLTYVDPIGKYLEVKDVNKLLLFGKEYNIIKDGEVQTEEIDDQTITKQYYKAVNQSNQDETIINEAYGEKVKFNLSDIKIWVEVSNDYDTGEGRDIDTNFDEALHITIPREAVPIQIDTVEFDESGKIIRYDSNTGTDESLPLRVIYEIGISEKIINEKGKIDLSRLSQEYFTQHKKTVDGVDYIEFFSNYYSSENYDEETNDTFGNAAATFVPSDENRFYIFQKNLPIYKKSEGGDENGEGILKEDGIADGKVTLSEKVTNLNEIEKDKTYYFIIDYFVPYEGENGEKGRVEKYVLARKGSEFYSKNGECSLTYYDEENKEEVNNPGENIVVATKVGGKRAGNIEKLAVRKQENKTDTANMVLVPEYGGPNNLDSIVGYLGNNGKLRISATWLFINKVVNANVEKDHFYEPVNEEFEFKLDIDGDIGTENAIVYGVYTWNGNSWIPEKEKVYVVTDNEGYILNSEEKRTEYWVGNSEEEREVNEDGTITVYTDNTKSNPSELQVFKDEDKLESNYKITATLKTKKLTFTPTGEGNKVTTTFTLKDGEGLLLSSLNPGTKWTVTENLTEDQIRRNFNFEDITGRENDEDIVINDKTISGITEAGLTDEANYRNIFEEIFKTLTIEKEVPGKAGDKEKEWEFEIKLTPPENVILYDEYSYTGGSFDEEVEALEDGKIKFVKNEDGTSSGKIKLKHGQSVTIINLPNGTQYEVTELEANTNDYTTTSSNEAGTLNENKTVRFTNIMRTIQFEFTKVKNENLSESLPGTEFKLYKLVCTDETHIEEHNKLIDESNLSECWKLYDEVQSDEDGKVSFTELMPHEEYRLVEAKAAIGRVKPEGQWRIICSSYEDDVRIIAIQGKQMPPAFVEESEGKLLLPNMPYYILPLSGSNTALMLTVIGCVQTLIGLVIMIIIKCIKKK